MAVTNRILQVLLLIMLATFATYSQSSISLGIGIPVVKNYYSGAIKATNDKLGILSSITYAFNFNQFIVGSSLNYSVSKNSFKDVPPGIGIYEGSFQNIRVNPYGGYSFGIQVSNRKSKLVLEPLLGLAFDYLISNEYYSNNEPLVNKILDHFGTAVTVGFQVGFVFNRNQSIYLNDTYQIVQVGSNYQVVYILMPDVVLHPFQDSFF